MGRTKRDTFVQLVVPQGLRLQILQGAHDDVLAGHLCKYQFDRLPSPPG